MSWLAVLACLGVAASGADQDQPRAQDPPTPVEQALVEHQCRAIRATHPADISAYDTCLSTQLLSLRTDFGRDLGRLSPKERRTVDAVCNKIRTAEGRDAYVACLSRQLVSLRSRGAVAPAEPSVGTTTALPPASSPAPPIPAPQGEKKSSALTMAVIAAAVLIAGVAAAAWFMMKGRPPSTVCRTCGAAVPGGGDLCQRCRHQAAEAQRRAAMERAESERAPENAPIDVPIRLSDMGQVGRVRELGWVGQVEHLGHVDRVGRPGEVGLVGKVGPSRDDQVRRSYETAEPGEFDPHVILGLLPNASREAIEGAYREARARYDADQVAHLGPEAREHFRAKAEAVERAYRMLADGDNASEKSLV